ncbi:MAG: CHAP domain-containing protein [Patescibacteria group bacterium]
MSKLGETSGALVEEDTCSNFFCIVFDFFWGLKTNIGGTTTFNNSTMPAYLRLANQMLLSSNPEVAGDFEEKREEPSGISGSLAKLASPAGFDGEDVLKALYNSEGKLVSGTVLLNQQKSQTGFNKPVGTDYGEEEGGFYKKADGESYQIPARFGEVSPLADRFGILKQSFFPPAEEEVDLAATGCEAYDEEGNIVFDPTPIDVTYLPNPDPIFATDWTAAWKIKPFEEGEDQSCTNPDDPSTCNAGSATGGVGGDLDTNSKVSLTKTAWERIGAPIREGEPNSGGIYNILLFPGQEFATTDAEAGVGYSYNATQGSGSSGDAQLFIAELGNVEGAVNCITRGITANPWEADETACEIAFGYTAGGIGTGSDELPPNTSSSSIARRAWEIVNGLQRGFGGLWNHSTDFPELFDDEYFAINPSADPYDVLCPYGNCLFWCTWLVFKTHPNPGPSLNSQVMQDYYTSTGRFIPAAQATKDNIGPGYVVFFQVLGGPGRTNHVGIVYSVTQDTITFVQSNAGTKTDKITFNGSGRGVQNLPWAIVVGFGAP